MNDYAFELFESGNAAKVRETAAPERHVGERKRTRLQKVDPKSLEEKKREERVGNRKIVFAIAFAAVILFVIFCQLSAGAERYELIHQIAEVEAQIKVEQSENVRLNAKLNEKMNINRIDSFAVEELNMKKIESYQVECVNLSQGDQVLEYSSFGWPK